MSTKVLTDSGLIVYDQEMKNFIDKKLEDKVSAEDGKGLSTNDYNDEEKNTVAQNKEDIEKLKREFDTTEPNNDITTTTESTLENSYEGGLLINEIRGKTEQNASNPSASTPQEVKSVVINTIKTTGTASEIKEITLAEPLELHGIGNVYDIATSESVTRSLIKVVFDGADDEGWIQNNGYLSTAILADSIKVPVSQNDVAEILCSMATATSMSNLSSTMNSIAISADGNLNIHNSYSSNVEGWKTFLRSNPMVVVCRLSTSIVENLSNADAIALNSLKTFEGTTYIETDSEIEPVIEVDYGCSEIGATALDNYNNIIINKIIASSMGSDTNTTYTLSKENGKIVLTGSDGSETSVNDDNTVYTHPSYTARTGIPTENQTPTFGGTFSITQPVSDASGHITEMNSRTVTIPNATATTTTAGLMSSEDKTKLDAIPSNAKFIYVQTNQPSTTVDGSIWIE